MLSRAHPWGDLFIADVDRSGGVRYHLTLFPPGISAGQRRALVFRRRWIPWGAIAGFLAASGLSTVVNGWGAIALGVGLYIGALLIANKVAGDARQGVVELDAQRVSAKRDPDAFGDLQVFEETAARLLEIDELAGAKAIEPVEYQRRWGEAYRAVAAHQTDPEFE